MSPARFPSSSSVRSQRSKSSQASTIRRDDDTIISVIAPPTQIQLHTVASAPLVERAQFRQRFFLLFGPPRLARHAGKLPAGFRVGTTCFGFTPREVSKPAEMTLTLIALDRPSPDFAAVFTRNAFPGAPVIIGRRRLAEPALGAILVNNKISNVCAPGGVEAAEQVCAEAARLLHQQPHEILPSSTGVIGWQLPVGEMLSALPRAVAALNAGSILPAAESIVTTDLFPKVRSAEVGGGRIVGIAKGAGMIEPNLATMLVYVLTDVAVPREALRAMLARAVDVSFNCISVDSDTSTSDTVVAVSCIFVPVIVVSCVGVFCILVQLLS